ncbi:uncharacterized protein LOC142357608, partial [Convolutriloba macropyga]|uniref:uncharacterized protein LOC142357608 n=1 Tax=Convolutriloba macropyga TaxID=536237 RepID=UPI003F5231B4
MRRDRNTVTREMHEARLTQVRFLKIHANVLMLVVSASFVLLCGDQYFVLTAWMADIPDPVIVINNISSLPGMKKLEKFALEPFVKNENPEIFSYLGDLYSTVGGLENGVDNCFRLIDSSLSWNTWRAVFMIGNYSVVHHVNIWLPKL